MNLHSENASPPSDGAEEVFFYRYRDIKYAPPLDEYEIPLGDGKVEVVCERYPVTKRTPKGVWLDIYGERKFVRLDANKRFACPTVEEALESFVARKTAQIRIYEARAKAAKQALALTHHLKAPTFV